MNLKQLKAEARRSRLPRVSKHSQSFEARSSSSCGRTHAVRTRMFNDGESDRFILTVCRLEQALQSVPHWDFNRVSSVNEWHEPIVVASDAKINSFSPTRRTQRESKLARLAVSCRCERASWSLRDFRRSFHPPH